MKRSCNSAKPKIADKAGSVTGALAVAVTMVVAPEPRALTLARIRRSSMRCRIGAMNEAWRDLDIAGGKDDVGKPRPVVIDDRPAALDMWFAIAR